ncbi:MAG: hypothetical protein ABSC22_20970 [Roseiarcus sp.]
MSKSRRWLSAAALAASAVPALASVPLSPPLAERPPAPLVGATGLTAADLIVGRDATLAFDVKALGVKVADGNSSTNRNCSENTNNGC